MNCIQTSASSDWRWIACENMFPEVSLRSLASSVCRDQRDKAGAELEREREEHRARETPPFLATDPIKVWSGGLSWFSFHRTPGYGDLVPKPLYFIITCPRSPRHCQLLFSGLEYWGKGGEACALVGVGTNLGSMSVTFPQLYKHHHNLGNGCPPGCK